LRNFSKIFSNNLINKFKNKNMKRKRGKKAVRIFWIIMSFLVLFSMLAWTVKL